MSNINSYIWVPVLMIGFCICGCGTATAASPQLPCEFFGQVSVSEVPAIAGMMITALVNGTPQGTIMVNESGKYGGTGTFDARLIVMAGENDFANGVPMISFLINDKKAEQTAPYQPGASTELNLTYNGRGQNQTAPLPLPAPVVMMSGPSNQTESYEAPLPTSTPQV